MAKGRQPQERSFSSEVLGVVLVACAIFLLFAFYSYQPNDPQANTVGLVGYVLADLFCSALGKMCYLLPGVMLYAAGVQFQLLPWTLPLSQGVSALTFALASAAVLALWYGDAYPVAQAGGWLGSVLAHSLRHGVNQFGAYLVLTAILVVSFMGASRVSLQWAGSGLFAQLGLLLARVWQTVQPLPERAIASLKASFSEFSFRPSLLLEDEEADPVSPPAPKKRAGRKPQPMQRNTQSDDEDWQLGIVSPAHPGRESRQQPSLDPEGEAAAKPPIIINQPPLIQAKTKKARPTSPPAAADNFGRSKPYTLPSLDLLDPPPQETIKIDENALHASSQILESKLHDFGVKGHVVAVRPGPVITTYEFEPAPGVKVNRVVSLADDLQMALRAVSVRILAPIPGKAVVGIEVSNEAREKVSLREIIDSPGFQQQESPLSLALGKDPVGNPVVSDLARMPHLLVAGATGTGKSVSLNAMIMSLLYRATPRDVRFIMIDPKMLELSVYENLPHQLSHVITNPKEAGTALQEVVRRMEYRYKLLRDKGVRNIASYNRVLETGQSNIDSVIKLTDVIHEGEEENELSPPSTAAQAVRSRAAKKEETFSHQRLPYLVVIVDELADLMLTVGREIEEPITRLAQMGRASGIHLILATQRPSVDVITGLIKANFPARVSFQVSSRIDSRTILDATGAERLLGAGDMLFLPPGSAKPQRIHGAFVSEAEISKAAAAIKQQGQPVFDSELVTALEKARSQKSLDAADDDTYDEMYEQARELVIETRQASISYVQRRLRVGYNRAARMIERMEREGLIAPAAEAGKPREVLVEAVDIMDQ